MGLPPMPHDDRYVRSEEFLTILKGLWTQQHFSFEGRYYKIDDITLTPAPIRKPHPTIYLGGESDVGQRMKQMYWLIKSVPMPLKRGVKFSSVLARL